MCCNETPCGDIYAPPTRGNMSLFAILELVIMAVVAVLCIIELVRYLGDGQKFDFIKFLVLFDDILVVLALGYIVYGLFCGITAGKIKIGIILFVVATILAMVIIVLQIIKRKVVGDKIWYKIAEFIIFLFLAWILWKQAARL